MKKIIRCPKNNLLILTIALFGMFYVLIGCGIFDGDNSQPSIGTITNQLLYVGEETQVKLDVTDVDADDTHVINFSLDDTSVATVSVSDTTLTIIGVAAGIATITVSVLDNSKQDNSVSTPVTFQVIVIKTITDQILYVGEETQVEFNIADENTDDRYIVDVSSDDTSVAPASLRDTTLTIIGVAAGTTTITVSVTDNSSRDNAALTTFQVTVREPNQGYIQGPWLWMIASGSDINTDYLAVESKGAITETQVAENGVNEGDYLGELQWTRGYIHPTVHCGWLTCSSNNINNALIKIGLTDRDLDHHAAYALINIVSTREQNDIGMGVGSDDEVKVWLNGAVVHINNVDRGTEGVQDRFRVNLKAGDNLLLVKVGENYGNWGLFFALGIESEDFTTAIPKSR